MWLDHGTAAFDEARERGSRSSCSSRGALPGQREDAPRAGGARGALEGRFVLVSASREDHPEVDAEHRGAGWPTLAVLGCDGTRSRRIETADPEEP